MLQPCLTTRNGAIPRVWSSWGLTCMGNKSIPGEDEFLNHIAV